jgi:hypothetical protein
MFLTGCVGNLIVPVGAPQLQAMAAQESGMEPEALVERRRRALFALATLGENVKRFGKLSDDQRARVLAELESASEVSGRRVVAQRTLEHLRKRQEGTPDTLGVGPALIQCAGDDDPALRLYAALAITFWVGTGPEEAELEKALVRLAHDDGRGEEELVERLEKSPTSKYSRELTRRKGFRVQPQAVIALARRGSPQTPLDTLAIMLDEEQLRNIFVLQDKRTNVEQPNEALVVLTINDSLKALTVMAEQLRRKKADAFLAQVKERFGGRVDELAQHRNTTLRTEAVRAQLALKGG